MRVLRFVLTCALIFSLCRPAGAQAPPATNATPVTTPASSRLNLTVPPGQLIPSAFRQVPASAAMHPAAKGALIGGAAGAGFWGAVAVWYCTAGPSEVGECENVGQWGRGFAFFGAIGAGVGALIGAMVAGR